jgi:photosystem II stability/assembly factor-like uncharacterized protein
MLAAVVLAASSPASAGINTWTGIGPDGGRVRKIILPQGSSDPVYALAEAAGFVRSLDGGGHWLQNTDDIAPRATDFGVDPANPNRVFLVIDQLPSRVLLSVDAGATFSTLYAFPQSMGTPTNITISADGNTLYCLSAATVMQSIDRGQSWQQRTNLPSASFPAELQVDPSDANTLYVARFDGLLATHDGGATWTNITPPGASVVDSVAVDPTNGNRLWAHPVLRGLSPRACAAASM